MSERPRIKLKEFARQMRKHFALGRSVAETARQMHVSRQYVSWVAITTNSPPPPRGPRKRYVKKGYSYKYPSDKVVQMYVNGDRVKLICETFGFNSNTLYRVLRKYSIPLRRPEQSEKTKKCK